jgi:predicted nucleotidyltransferase
MKYSLIGIQDNNKNIRFRYCIDDNIKRLSKALLKFYNNKNKILHIINETTFIEFISDITGEIYTNESINFLNNKDIVYEYLFDEELEFWTINNKRIEVYLYNLGIDLDDEYF